MFLLLWRKKLGKCTYKLPAQAQVLLKVYDRFYLHACTYALYLPYSSAISSGGSK